MEIKVKGRVSLPPPLYQKVLSDYDTILHVKTPQALLPIVL